MMIPDALISRIERLPKHLRLTAKALADLGRATAKQVADQTKRARAVESGYLNFLVILGIAKKERDKQEAIFTLKGVGVNGTV